MNHLACFYFKVGALCLHLKKCRLTIELLSLIISPSNELQFHIGGHSVPWWGICHVERCRFQGLIIWSEPGVPCSNLTSAAGWDSAGLVSSEAVFFGRSIRASTCFLFWCFQQVLDFGVINNLLPEYFIKIYFIMMYFIIRTDTNFESKKERLNVWWIFRTGPMFLWHLFSKEYYWHLAIKISVLHTKSTLLCNVQTRSISRCHTVYYTN